MAILNKVSVMDSEILWDILKFMKFFLDLTDTADSSQIKPAVPDSLYLTLNLGISECSKVFQNPFCAKHHRHFTSSLFMYDQGCQKFFM